MKRKLNFKNLEIILNKNLIRLIVVEDHGFKIKKKIKKDEQFMPLEPKIMFYDNLDSELKAKHNKALKKYEDYNNFALNYEYHTIQIFQLTKEIMSEILFLINHEINYSLLQIKKYSNMETKIILLAFILQLIVFIVIQFFEVSATAAELKKGRKK